MYGAAGLSAHGVARRRRAAGLCVVLLVSVAVLTRRLRADLQRLWLDTGLQKACLRCYAAAQVRLQRRF